MLLLCLQVHGIDIVAITINKSLEDIKNNLSGWLHDSCHAFMSVLLLAM